MKSWLRISTTAAACLLLLSLIVILAVDKPQALSAPSTTYATKVKSTGYTSSAVCGQCHTEIYKNWRNSLHALAVKDPIFQAAYAEVIMDGIPGAKRLCLTCHAPTTYVTNDLDLSDGLSKEGVTCDFCHTVTDVHIGSRSKPFEVKPGRVKRGPVEKTSSPAHKIENSPLHRSAEFCGSCHEFKGANGVTIIGTYSEWRDSSHARRGIVCQDCHMRVTSAKAVKAGVGGSGHAAHMHDVPGGHSVSQLRKAVRVSIKSLKQAGDLVTAVVSLTNSGSGHCVPTGLPSRKLVLHLKVLNPEKVVGFQDRVVLQKVMAGADDKTLTGDAAIMLSSTRIVSDNRLRPGETRNLTFRFTKPRWTRVTVEAKLFYLYEPKVLKTERMSVEMAGDEKDVQ
jgi:hypothetical protein